MDLGLSDKTALVVGATSGLGWATAQVLLAEGARVFICGRQADRLEAALQAPTAAAYTAAGRLHGLVADVTEPTAATRLVEATAAAFGGLDILITNAGGPPAGNFETTPPSAWETAVRLTLLSAVDLIRAALPLLRRSPAAAILTITSMSVKQPVDGLLLSNVIRPAVVGLTKSLALELGPAGIRVNSILPGWTRTERVTYLLDRRAAANASSYEAEQARITDAIPLGRMAEPEEFGRVAAFLCSPAASYLTGVMLQVDGGNYRGLL